ncbi:MAG: hypothetical protein QOI47_1633 [Actinomycetota bacterium]|nr:hypothetical protein [Actinomycetota bacterium]
MPGGDGFSHEALFYRGDDELLARTLPFVREGVEAGEPVLVVLPQAKNDALRHALGPAAESVTFADMAEVGANPARIIPAWRWFVDAHAASGKRMRGIGEPINPDRHGAELVECHRHEALLNVEFADDPPLRLLCPYDVDALDPDVVAEAHRTHPYVLEDTLLPSDDYRPVDADEPFADLLVEPTVPVRELSFAHGPLAELRAFVAENATAAGLAEDRVTDLVLAVNEIATNSIQHGGGTGCVRFWCENATVVFEIVDQGLIAEALVGRRVPAADSERGRGIWMANQVCDLVQVHSTRGRTAVRLLMHV